jgi:hypothetical protein
VLLVGQMAAGEARYQRDSFELVETAAVASLPRSNGTFPPDVLFGPLRGML